MNVTDNKHIKGLAWLLIVAMLAFVVALPGCGKKTAASESVPASSGADSSAADASASAEEEETIFAPPGRGLYLTDYEAVAEAYCLVNEDTGLSVSEKNADTPYIAASLVKMMTCILTMEHMEEYGKDLDETLVESEGRGYLYNTLAGKNASTADIRLGETLSVRELLYACLLPSANEGALLLADFVSGGDLDTFVANMNAKARELGCTGTRFTDPNGLGEDNMTTARDMVLICREFMKHPVLVEIAGTSVYEMAQHERHNAPYNIFSTNRLLVQSSPYYNVVPAAAGTVVAGKTGTLGDWQNFVSMATKDGETYICAVLESPNIADTVAPLLELEPPAYRPALVEAMQLYGWAFQNLRVKSVLDLSQPVTELRVKYSSEQDTVRLMPSGDVKAVLPKGEQDTLVKRSYQLPDLVEAPVVKDTVLGSISLTLGGQPVGTANLLAEKDIPRNNTLFVMSKAGDFFRSTVFRVALVLALFSVGLYAGAVALIYNSKSRKKRTKKRSAGPGGGRPSGTAAGKQRPRDERGKR